MRRSSVLIFLLLFAVSLLAQQSTPHDQSSRVPAAVYEQMSPEPPPPPEAVSHTADGKAILADGTPLRCRLKRSLYSQKNKLGDQVEFEVLNQVALDGFITVPRGATALGVITDAASRRMAGRGGKLKIAISGVRLTNGETAKLRATPLSGGGRQVLAESGSLEEHAFEYIPFWYLIPLSRGDEVYIPADTEVMAYVDGDVTFDPTANGSQPQPVSAQVAPDALPGAEPVLVLGIAHLSLVSKPAGAEIEVDSHPVGTTPGALSLTPGDHVLRVTKKGFQPYERKLHFRGGDILLSVELDPVQ